MEIVKKWVYLAFIVVLLIASLAFVSNLTGVGKATRVFEYCTSGSYQCNGDTLQFCDGGFWVNWERCPRGCRDGACIAGRECTPGTYRCLVNYRQRCDGGIWKNAEMCRGECRGGVCVYGSQCDTGTFRCVKDYLQECRGGRWYSSVRCNQGCSGDTCKDFSDIAECSDSDGRDYNMRGYVTGIDRYNRPFSYSDKCESFDLLTEYVCEGNNVKKYSQNCIVCEEGRCKSADEVSDDVPYVDEEMPQESVDEEPIEEEPMRIVLDGQDTVFSRIANWFRNLF